MIMSAILGITALFALMLLRVPISFAMFIVGFFGIYYVSSPEAAFNLISTGVWEQFSAYAMSVIPLFIFMGEIVFRAGITDRLFKAAYAWVGHLRGGMASTTILSCAGFSAISGSNTATAATVGVMALPEMKKYGYNTALSTGSIASGGTLGVIIPPSTVLIVIALQAELSVGDLFVASIIPGLILTLLFILTVWFLCRRNPDMGPAGEISTLKEKIKSLNGVVEVIFLFVLVIGGLFAGWFTSTEAAAVGCVGGLLVVLFQRKLSWSHFKEALNSTLRSSAMILMLVTGAVVFGRFLTITRLPYDIGEWAATLPVPSVLIIAFIFCIYTIGGALMDAMGFLIISMPIFFPVATALGYDPIWFGVMICIITSMGAITPPVGVNAFIVSGLDPSISLTTVFRGVSYFLVAYVICILLLMALPQLVLFPL